MSLFFKGSSPRPSHPEKPNLNSEHECHDILCSFGSANCSLPNSLFSFRDQEKKLCIKVYKMLNPHYRRKSLPVEYEIFFTSLISQEIVSTKT